MISFNNNKTVKNNNNFDSMIYVYCIYKEAENIIGMSNTALTRTIGDVGEGVSLVLKAWCLEKNLDLATEIKRVCGSIKPSVLAEDVSAFLGTVRAHLPVMSRGTNNRDN